jgi:hypothetical protein
MSKRNLNERIDEVTMERREDSYATIDDIMVELMKLEEEEEIIGQELMIKEEKMRQMINIFKRIQKFEKRVLNDMNNLYSEYETLLEQADEIDMEEYNPDSKLIEKFEKAKEILASKGIIREGRETDLDDLEALISDLRAELNQIRYKAKKTPEEVKRQKELIYTLEEARRKISEITNDMYWKDCE